MRNIKIKKNIKFPNSTTKFGKTLNGRGYPSAWPLAQLKIGDGFETEVSNANAVRTSIQHYQRWYQGVRFMTKIVGEKILIKRTA